MPKSVYDHPRFYDLAFSYRDFERETSVIERWFKSHSGKRTVLSSVLELASGPARHAITLAKKGISAAALDRSAAMCAYAKLLAEKNSVSLEVFQADMESFDLARKFSLILNMIDSVSHIKTKAALVRHLKRVAAHLENGGIYLIETAKVEEDEDRTNTKDEWQIDTDETRLLVKWQCRAKRGKSHEIHVQMLERGKLVVNDSMLLRQWSKAEIEEAIDQSDCFDVGQIYGAFSPKMSWKSPHAWRLLFVLRKRLKRN